MRRAVELTPHDPTMHDHYAEVLFKASKVREAIAQWEASLARVADQLARRARRPK